jgi:signal peptidase I
VAGDVITFQRAPGVAEYVTHRVVRVQRDTTPMSFITKGDANRGEDLDPVPFGAVRGTVRFHVPYVGIVSDFVQTPAGLAVTAGVLLGIWVLPGLLRSVSSEVSGTRGRRDADTDVVVDEDPTPGEASHPLEVG